MLLLERDRPNVDVDAESGSRDETRSSDERVLLCARCAATVTRVREAIEVDGRHAHVFTNPSGVTFRVRCFRTAEGCRPIGEASSFFSWFSGHTWTLSVCAACLGHLGWRFDGASSFYGLVEDRLIEGAGG